MNSVLHLLGPSTGGIRRHVAVLASAQEAEGWRVAVAGPSGVMAGLDRDQHDLAVGAGLGSVRSLRSLRRLGSEVDIVHAHGLKAGWTARAAGLGAKTVLTVHNLVLAEAAGRSAVVLRPLEKALPGQVAATIAISTEIAEHLTGTLDRRIVVIPPVGPSPVVTRSAAEVRAELGISDGMRLVVQVGRLHPQKDVDNLIAASRNWPADVVTVVVGEGPDERRLRTVLAETPDAAVHLVGSKPDAPNYLSAADVVVSAARWEGFGLVIAEALRLGRPVVATDVGPVSTMVIDGRTGLLVAPEDPDALGAAVGSLLDDPDRARRLGAEGARHMEQAFSVSELIDEVEKVYRAVMDR